MALILASPFPSFPHYSQIVHIQAKKTNQIFKHFFHFITLEKEKIDFKLKKKKVLLVDKMGSPSSLSSQKIFSGNLLSYSGFTKKQSRSRDKDSSPSCLLGMLSLEILNCEVRPEKVRESQENISYRASSQWDRLEFSPDRAL